LSKSSLLRTYPLGIQADQNKAALELRGGTAAVPVIFSGLSDYRRPVIEKKSGDAWVITCYRVPPCSGTRN
jgi:hypothetical protein